MQKYVILYVIYAEYAIKFNRQNMQNNMQKNICRICKQYAVFWWYCCILSSICKICKIICKKFKICEPNFNMQNIHSHFADIVQPGLLQYVWGSEQRQRADRAWSNEVSCFAEVCTSTYQYIMIPVYTSMYLENWTHSELPILESIFEIWLLSHCIPCIGAVHSLFISHISSGFWVHEKTTWTCLV